MYQDNSTNISNSNGISGNQFASGSKDFQGVINNITPELAGEFERITNSLVKQLQETPVKGVETEQVVDAIKQVESQVKQKKINKISITGLVAGINMVIQNAEDISTKVISLYDKWNALVNKIIA